jgi:hypothetical protein
MYTVPSILGKKQQQQQQRHLSAMFSGATFTVVSNPYDPLCTNGSSSNSSRGQQRPDHASSCWQSEAASLSEHLSDVMQVQADAHQQRPVHYCSHLTPHTSHLTPHTSHRTPHVLCYRSH